MDSIFTKTLSSFIPPQCGDHIMKVSAKSRISPDKALNHKILELIKHGHNLFFDLFYFDSLLMKRIESNDITESGIIALSDGPHKKNLATQFEVVKKNFWRLQNPFFVIFLHDYEQSFRIHLKTLFFMPYKVFIRRMLERI